MTSVPASEVRIPSTAREALARNEAVIVVSRGRPAYVIVTADAYDAVRQPAAPRGRRLRDVLAMLAVAESTDLVELDLS
jgi:prevent-host-death family protein